MAEDDGGERSLLGRGPEAGASWHGGDQQETPWQKSSEQEGQ